MILTRRPLDTSRGPVYRIDLVETEGGLGYLSTVAPTIRVIQRDACPVCGDTEEWQADLKTGEAVCPCGHEWNFLA